MAVKDVPFNPVSVFDNFITSAAGGTGDSSGRDRGTNLSNRASAFVPSCL